MATLTTKSILAAAALAASVMAGSANAEAGQRTLSFQDSGASVITVGHKRHWHKHRRWHHGGVVVIGNPYHSCHYLKRKARFTGSRYWWKQYKTCIRSGGYYY